MRVPGVDNCHIILQLVLYDGCMVFFVHVLPCFKAPWNLESRPVG